MFLQLHLWGLKSREHGLEVLNVAGIKCKMSMRWETSLENKIPPRLPKTQPPGTRIPTWSYNQRQLQQNHTGVPGNSFPLPFFFLPPKKKGEGQMTTC